MGTTPGSLGETIATAMIVYMTDPPSTMSACPVM
jgi:hypothetical protein